MNAQLLEALNQWQSWGKRTYSITKGSYGSQEHLDIYIYDFTVMEGCSINGPEDLKNLNLYELKRQRVLRELAAINKEEQTERID